MKKGKIKLKIFQKKRINYFQMKSILELTTLLRAKMLGILKVIIMNSLQLKKSKAIIKDNNNSKTLLIIQKLQSLILYL